jgi:exopolysaccharide biosynthesis polyprenyl glycosylphosphotransferase
VAFATAAVTTIAAGMLVWWQGSVLDHAAAFLFWTTATAGALAIRLGYARPRRSAARNRSALIVGSGPQAVRVCRELSSDQATSYRVLGFVDTVDDATVARSRFVARRTVGRLDDLERILAREHVDEVHVGLPIRSHYVQIQDAIRVCERLGVKLIYRTDVFDTVLARPRLDPASPRVALRFVSEGFPLAVKRALDVTLAALMIVVLAPLMIAVAAAIKATSAGPVLFRQERFGLNRRRFVMLKFRTMVHDAERLQAALEEQNEAEGPVFKIALDPRITPLGRILRRTSIDELPQLFNVLNGEMSLVGPRPLPSRDVSRIARASDMRRFSVRPGITGLWQVSGRASLDFEKWIRLDLSYIDGWSLFLDIAILARTVPAVVRGTGAT